MEEGRIISNKQNWSRVLGEAGHRVKRQVNGVGVELAVPDTTRHPWEFTCTACRQTFKSNGITMPATVSECRGEKT